MLDSPPVRRRVALAAVAAVGAVTTSYLVSGLSPGFVVLPIDAFLINLAPGRLIGAIITRLGTAGHLLHQIPAALIAVLLFGVVAYAALWVALRRERRLLGGLVGAGAGTTLAGTLTGFWTLALGPGVILGSIVMLAPQGGTEIRALSVERRSVLRGAAGAATLLGLGGLRRVLVGSTEPPAPLDRGREEVESMLALAEDRRLGVGGLEGLVSSSHYEVDINPLSNPAVEAEAWELSITGAVENEVSFSYDELRSMDQQHRFVTLRCVSDSLNGKYMDTAVWTGVPTETVLSQARPQSGCECVMLRAADGYYVEVPLEPLRAGLLAYGMNGRFVPQKHGYPLRALVPGHWGEVNGKWLTEIEVLEKPTEGYWESPPRNWQGTGVVHTIAKLHVSRRLDASRVLVAGHAYAGTRGIQRVEVSTDDGDTWMTADLSAPLPGQDTWRQWELSYEQSGRETVLVRAVDGTGTVQPRERSEPYPSGATGWVETQVP
ncbi:MAG: molybdopterin-dependent oxidoreductase [Halodesulfurarchaeum sp.]